MAHGRILFISDLHLDASAPAAMELFLGFLRTEAAKCDGLYILGDLFDTWIGDDDDDPARMRIGAALRELTAGGVPCFIQHGNRDFMLGEGFLAASGCQLLPDPGELIIGGRRFALTHGDQLCTGDRRYQQFRRIVRNGLVQRAWRALPLWLRRGIAARLRRRSHTYTRQQPESLLDVTPAAVTALLHSAGADVLIHGHTHRPAIHRLEVDQVLRTRIVLGDWPTQASAVAVDADGRFTVQSVAAA